MTGGIELPYDLSWLWPKPPVRTTPEEERRWAICVDTARTCSECCEPSGIADEQFVAVAARQLYDSDIPTD